MGLKNSSEIKINKINPRPQTQMRGVSKILPQQGSPFAIVSFDMCGW